ncbi:hypothetical protein SGLAD_v1c09420 [Spiroplasma gladiatoris]|uniref:Lipoprotein n=1 Tax=Spiroplasma gladiatoris TaxID=2143 RepID=A0A4P7AIY3_9MOLU|nr:hypothetical protein [Spiroplasma gladiatoris]QBQ08141.1 hypothetical protein SGLAD_v1c09420 [Spiroplasma gladiatoris]
MKKLISLLAAMGMVSLTGAVASTVVACKNEKTDLSKLSVKELGKISGSGTLPTIDEIVKAINEKNLNYWLSSTDIVFEGTPTTSKATLKAKTDSTSFSGNVEVTYTYSVREKTDLSALKYKNMPAGYMVDGVYDRTNAEWLGQDKDPDEETVPQLDYKINAESVLFSLNGMNGTSLTTNDVDITVDNMGNQGLGALATIKAKENSNAKGSATLSLNKDVSFSGLLSNKDIDNIYINKEAKDTLTDDTISKNKFAFAALIMEAIGAKNPALEAFATVMVSAGASIAFNCDITMNNFNVKSVPVLNGIFAQESNVGFTIKFAEDTRAYVKKGKNSFVLPKTTDVSDKNNYIGVKKAIYEKLEADLKAKVDINEFTKFTRVSFKDNKYTVVILPGSNKLYSHDQMVPLIASKFILSDGELTISATIEK